MQKKTTVSRTGKSLCGARLFAGEPLPGRADSLPAAFTAGGGHAHAHLRRARPSSSSPPAHAQGPPRESPRTPRSLGGAAHAQSGGARQAPAPHPGGLCSEPDARPEANWEAESDVNRTSQPVSPAALRRRVSPERVETTTVTGFPVAQREWCGLQEGERKRSRSGPQRPTLTAFLSADRLGPRPARSTLRASASAPRPLGSGLGGSASERRASVAAQGKARSSPPRDVSESRTRTGGPPRSQPGVHSDLCLLQGLRRSWPAGGTGFRRQARQQDVICFSSSEEALPSPFPEEKTSFNTLSPQAAEDS
ncbi:translation initiation factor IF-2 [Odocoileus virginianus]|uniref:Translation initiation factor IF-2 n=1 Tax=Odocoileus virginianus TaxID=9874 RepID=A0ABM4J871_ODOVR